MNTYQFLDLADSNAPYISQLIEAATRVITSGRYIGGPEVEVLEDKMAALTGATHAIGVSNGLDALTLILKAAIVNGILMPGDQIAVPANTYIASILAILHAGLSPLLVDPDPATMNISAQALEKAISPKTRALMTVHLYGRTAWDSEIEQIVSRHGLFTIEDAAQAIGAQDSRAKNVGNLAQAAAFSFYPTKNVGALGDAGMVTTSDPRLAATIRTLANYGADTRYHNILPGHNCRLDPIQAAMIAVKLPYVKFENDDRREKASIYNELIKNPAVITPNIPPFDNGHVFHQYVIRVAQGHSRDQLKALLDQQGVRTDIHYPTPPHLQPCLSHIPHGPLPLTETLAESILSLPIGPSTTTEQARQIAHIINHITQF